MLNFINGKFWSFQLSLCWARVHQSGMSMMTPMKWSLKSHSIAGLAMSHPELRGSDPSVIKPGLLDNFAWNRCNKCENQSIHEHFLSLFSQFPQTINFPGAMRDISAAWPGGTSARVLRTSTRCVTPGGAAVSCGIWRHVFSNCGSSQSMGVASNQFKSSIFEGVFHCKWPILGNLHIDIEDKLMSYINISKTQYFGHVQGPSLPNHFFWMVHLDLSETGYSNLQCFCSSCFLLLVDVNCNSGSFLVYSLW